jgi:hypothetical protein
VKLDVGVIRVKRVVIIKEVGLLLDQLVMNLIMLVVRGHVDLLLLIRVRIVLQDRQEV